jgi:hypothetical protein
MLNYEVTASLVRERRHEMTHNATLGRLARRARRGRRQDVTEADQLYATIILPPPVAADVRHPAAA